METKYTVKQRDIILNSPKDKIKIWFFGDIHKFTGSHDEVMWKRFLTKVKSEHDDNTFYMGLGDYTDFAASKEQKSIIMGNVHDQTLEDLGQLVKKRNRAISTELSFMRPNILGLIEGNHSWRFHDGKTLSEDLAERLGTEYLGWLSFFTLKIKVANSTKYIKLYIVACHGRAGGKTRGATINQFDDLWRVFPTADIYVMGHDHQRYVMPSTILMPTYDGDGETTLKQKNQYFVRSGSFKKAYEENKSSYEVSRLFRPANLGASMVEISIKRMQSKGKDVLTPEIISVI